METKGLIIAIVKKGGASSLTHKGTSTS